MTLLTDRDEIVARVLPPRVEEEPVVAAAEEEVAEGEAAEGEAAEGEAASGGAGSERELKPGFRPGDPVGIAGV